MNFSLSLHSLLFLQVQVEHQACVDDEPVVELNHLHSPRLLPATPRCLSHLHQVVHGDPLVVAVEAVRVVPGEEGGGEPVGTVNTSKKIRCQPT